LEKVFVLIGLETEEIMANLDQILNIAIPTLLFLIVFGYIYTKLLEPWVVPHLRNLWEWIKGGGTAIHMPQKKEIIYE
jgi:hypothetical protein